MTSTSVIIHAGNRKDVYLETSSHRDKAACLAAFGGQSSQHAHLTRDELHPPRDRLRGPVSGARPACPADSPCGDGLRRRRAHPMNICDAKRRYRDEIAARLALAELTRKDKRVGPKAERRVYHCPTCHGWHLTLRGVR